MEPSPPPAPQTPPPAPTVQRRYFLLGVGLGLIPVVALWVWTGGGFQASGVTGVAGNVALITYIAVIIGAIVCLFIRQVRYLGYGLLTMTFVAPIVGVIGCLVIPSIVQA
jgi:hypothetical protein